MPSQRCHVLPINEYSDWVFWFDYSGSGIAWPSMTFHHIYIGHVTHNLVAIPPSHLSIPLVVTCTSNYYIFIWNFEWRVGFMVIGVTLTKSKNGEFTTATLLIKFPKNEYSELTILLLFLCNSGRNWTFSQLNPINQGIKVFLGARSHDDLAYEQGPY